MNFYLKAKAEDGELIILNKELVRQFFLQHNGKHFEVSVKELQETMSSGWMRWYRGIAVNLIIDFIRQSSGEEYSPDEIHAYNVSEIVKPRIHTKEVMGKTIVETKEFSLKGLPKKKWMEFKNKLQVYWAERGLEIPDPNEGTFMNDNKGYDKLRNFKINSAQED